MAVSAEARRAVTNSDAPPDGMPHALPKRGGEVRSTLTMTALQMTGKSLGLLKTLVIAAWFGASAALDAFWIAYAIPAILPGMVRGVVATAFIPGFMRSALKGGEGVDWRGLNTLITLIVVTVVALALLVFAGRHAVVTFMAPGLDRATHDLAADLTGLMSIAMLFFGINAIFAAVLQALRRFVVMSLESIVTNIVIIAACVLLADRYGVRGLTLAVIAGFAMHTVMLALANRDLLARHIRPALDFGHADFREPARHMLPLLIGYIGSVVMSIIDRMFVSTLDAGMISVLAYASMIALLPMEVFGQAAMTAFYPSLSRDHAAADVVRMRETHIRGLRFMIFVLLPVTVALVIAARPAVTLLLERGAFSAEAASLTAMTLAALALGLPARAINYFNFRVFHARQEPWTAVLIGLVGVALNALLDWIFIIRYGVVGIAFATSIAMTLSAVLSTLLVRRRLQSSVLRPLAKPVGQLLLMTLAFAGVTLLCVRAGGWLLPMLHGWQAALVALGAFVPGAVAFVAVGLLLRVDETRLLLRLVRGRRMAEGT